MDGGCEWVRLPGHREWQSGVWTVDQNKTKEVVLQAVATRGEKDTSGPTFIDYYLMYCTVRNVYTETETFLDYQRPIWKGWLVEDGIGRKTDRRADGRDSEQGD